MKSATLGRMKRKVLKIADLFCGAGGFSEGGEQAAESLDFEPQITAINHWPVACATFKLNHKKQRDPLCTGVESVNPRDYYKEGELDVLLASPECTHHSQALGGKPMNDQSRSTAWCVVKWVEATCPKLVVVENVPEFQSWGPLVRVRCKKRYQRTLKAGERLRKDEVVVKLLKGGKRKVKGERMEWGYRPDPNRKGETFKAWLATLQSLGYKTGYRVLKSSNYGDPTSRERLIIVAVRGKKRVVWPKATHSEFYAEGLRRWQVARGCIDFSIPSKSIFGRKHPLSQKTIDRIFAGMRKFSNLEPFIVPNFGERDGQTPRTHSVNHPMPTVTSHGAGAIVEPFIVPQNSSNGARSVDEPVPTLTTTSRGVGLATPFVVEFDNSSNGAAGSVRSVDQPVSTVVTKARHGVAEPFLVELHGSEASHVENSSKPLDAPLGTVCANGQHHGIAQPFLVNMKGKSTAADLDLPSPTITAHAAHLAMVEPFLVNVAHGNGEDPNGIANERRVKGLDEPMPTVCGSRGEMALIEPSVLPQHQGGSLRPVSQPMPTVATAGAIALVEAFLVSFYGNGQSHDIEAPVPTVTCKDRFGLVLPVIEIEGSKYLLDIHFRMLQPHELALAQGFRPDYKFTGNKTEKVKQIGNAVTRRMVRAVIGANLAQKEDVTFLLQDDDGDLWEPERKDEAA